MGECEANNNNNPSLCINTVSFLKALPLGVVHCEQSPKLVFQQHFALTPTTHVVRLPTTCIHALRKVPTFGTQRSKNSRQFHAQSPLNEDAYECHSFNLVLREEFFFRPLSYIL